MTAQSDVRRRISGWISIAAFGVVGLVFAASTLGGSQSAASGPWLEFNVPPQGASQITGFVIGYFVPGETAPAFTFEVARSQVESPRQDVMRVPHIVSKLPAGQVYEIRLRTVARRQRSGWSEPSGTFKVPDDGGAPATVLAVPVDSAKKPADRAPRRPTTGRSAVTELEGNPELSARLSKQFSDVDLPEAATGFRNLRDFSAALFVAANLKIPFQDVKRLTADAGSRDFRKAIAVLKPDVDASAEAQRALSQSRQVLRAAPAKKPKKQ